MELEIGKTCFVESDKGALLEAEIIDVLPPSDKFYPGYYKLRVKVPKEVSNHEYIIGVPRYTLQEWLAPARRIKKPHC